MLQPCSNQVGGNFSNDAIRKNWFDCGHDGYITVIAITDPSRPEEDEMVVKRSVGAEVPACAFWIIPSADGWSAQIHSRMVTHEKVFWGPRVPKTREGQTHGHCPFWGFQSSTAGRRPHRSYRTSLHWSVVWLVVGRYHHLEQSRDQEWVMWRDPIRSFFSQHSIGKSSFLLHSSRRISWSGLKDATKYIRCLST